MESRESLKGSGLPKPEGISRQKRARRKEKVFELKENYHQVTNQRRLNR